MLNLKPTRVSGPVSGVQGCSAPIIVKSWSHICDSPLADPDYATPGEIDLLIGADFSGHLFLNQSLAGGFDEPVA